MKSKFAKFIDSTIGACLIFFAAVAVMRYYTTLDLAVFCAFAITACVCLLLKLSGVKKTEKHRLSVAADGMFFDFMFMPDDAPIKQLYNGLKEKLPSAVLRGKGVYTADTAAFCYFDCPPNEKELARLISKAKRFRANKIIVLSKSPMRTVVDIEGFTVKSVCGEDVYKLYGSLGALPKKQFSSKQKSRRTAFYGALGKDKILRYALLSAAMFGISILNGYSIMTFACACVCAALCVAAVGFNIYRAATKKRKN